MAAGENMLVRFWGVRGSIACPGERTLRYGGNTSCVEVRCGDHLIVLDAGTGIHVLGNNLMRPGAIIDADILFSHTHFDHICGVPFFAPLFVQGNRLRFWAGHLRPRTTIEQVLRQSMASPLFPIQPDAFRAQIEFRDFNCGDSFSPRPGVSVRTGPLNHPDNATGYRIEYGGKSVAYITDTEHKVGGGDQNILTLVKNADVMIYDTTYTDEEYATHAGWGHSTWQEALRLADRAGVGTVVAFHHDPSHDDSFLDGIAARAERTRPGTLVAAEGLELRL